MHRYHQHQECVTSASSTTNTTATTLITTKTSASNIITGNYNNISWPRYDCEDYKI